QFSLAPNEMRFTTSTAPVALTSTFCCVTHNSATIGSIINANGPSTAVTFRYGTAPGVYTNTVTATPPTVSGFFNTPVTAAIAGLAPNTTYYFRAFASNPGGTGLGQQQQFTTARVPTATTLTNAPYLTSYGQQVTFTATVTSGGNPVTQGTVTLREGAAVLASGLPLSAGGTAQFSTSTLGVGPHGISADYIAAPPTSAAPVTSSRGSTPPRSPSAPTTRPRSPATP